jgi:hypothetical protein
VNLYAYCNGDPVNRYDPSGTTDAGVLPAPNSLPWREMWETLKMAFSGFAANNAGINDLDGPFPYADVILVLVASGVGIAAAVKFAKSISIPSFKKVTIDMPHILGNHGPNSNKPGKDKFPKWTTSATIAKIIQEAYKSGERIKTQMDGSGDVRILLRGYSETLKGYVEIWVNTATKTIETAYPVNIK